MSPGADVQFSVIDLQFDSAAVGKPNRCGGPDPRDHLSFFIFPATIYDAADAQQPTVAGAMSATEGIES